MNDVDLAEMNVTERLDFWREKAETLERLNSNLRIMVDVRNELLAEKDAENVALQAKLDAIPVQALYVVVMGLYQALEGNTSDAPNDALDKAVAWCKEQLPV